MFILAGTEIDDQLYALVKDNSFIIWGLKEVGIDRLNSAWLPDMCSGSWHSMDFANGSFVKHYYFSPDEAGVLLCRVSERDLKRLGCDNLWLRTPFWCDVGAGDPRDDSFELVPLQEIKLKFESL